MNTIALTVIHPGYMYVVTYVRHIVLFSLSKLSKFNVDVEKNDIAGVGLESNERIYATKQ